MTTLFIVLQGIFASMITSCILVLLIAAVRYMRADPEKRILIAPAPSGENIIPFRNTRLNAPGLKLVVPAVNPSRGGNA
jgi:hypothetical protein